MKEKAAFVDADTKVAVVTGTKPSGDIQSGIKSSIDHATVHGAATVLRSGKIDQLDTAVPADPKQMNLIVLSLLLAAVTLVVLWRSRGQPLLVVWLLSFTLYFMSSLWTGFFLVETRACHPNRAGMVGVTRRGFSSRHWALPSPSSTSD